KATLVSNSQRAPSVKQPAGLTTESFSHVLVSDAATGELYRIRVATGAAEQVAGGFGAPAGLTYDWHARLYVTDHRGGRGFVVGRPGMEPVALAAGLPKPAAVGLGPEGKTVLVADAQAGTLTALPTQVPGAPVDETPLPLETAVAFPDLKWTGWDAESATGKIVPPRPILLTHARDGSHRNFVATPAGAIHVFPNDPKAAKTKVFLDIQERVVYNDNQNEEGFLGVAFPPDYKTKGEFYVFYTLKSAKMTNVLSRFKVSRDDPDRADPESEEVLLRIKRPFWNHDGGTLCFGPDGYLYLALGDGGAANDPFDNGQNLKSLLGGVLRLDVSRRDDGKPYAIPKDNPFVGRADAVPEKWAYGLR